MREVWGVCVRVCVRVDKESLCGDVSGLHLIAQVEQTWRDVLVEEREVGNVLGYVPPHH